jgi:hypothetical protein
VTNGTFPSSERRPWVGILIRGWRLEIALALVALFVLGLSSQVGSAGPELVVALLVTVFRFRPNLRAKLETTLRERRDLRALDAALWQCAVVGRRGDIPRAVRSASLPVGRRYLVSLPVGLHFEALKKREAELAAALSVREVRVKPFTANSRYIEIAVIRANAFPKSFPSLLLARWRVSLWESVPFGVGQDGLPVPLHLPEHNLLIGGEPGSGKSVALSTIVGAAALDPTVHLTLLDGKDVELIAWSGVADEFVGADREAAVEVLEGMVDLMDERYQQLVATRRRKVTPGDLDGLHVVVIDEVAFYLRGGEKASREHFTELLRDLVSRGRAAGIIVVAATQKPSHDVVPTFIRDLFAYRLALRCTSPEASDTILGQGWAHQGYSAATIDPATRGVGYLLAEGGAPVLMMTPYLSDDDVELLAGRALELRELA